MSPAGFVIELEDGYRVYHAGDTQVFGDMALIRDLHRPDLAMLPIGGHFTMDPTAAALAVELLGVKDVVPLHYGTFPILTGTPDQWRAALCGAWPRRRDGPRAEPGRIRGRLIEPSRQPVRRDTIRVVTHARVVGSHISR